MLVPALLLQMVSFYGDIAPVLAFQCNRCHGDEGIAAGVDTRTHQSFKETANFPLLMELLEGRRGEARRMPKDAPPLDAATIDKFRLWIAAGAPEDRDPNPPRVIRRELDRRPVYRFRAAVDGEAYIAIELQDPAGRLLHREAGVVRGSQEWIVRPAAHWPARLALVTATRYATAPASVTLLP